MSDMQELKVPVTAEDHAEGAEGAEVTLVEYGDFQCPDAGAAYPMVKRLRQHFGKRLRFVFRNFPLNRIHPMAELAAEVAEFAASHGKFWEMHDALYENQEELSPGMLGDLVEQLGLKREEAEQGAQSRKYRERVKRDVDGGRRSGVHGTPTFFVNGKLYQGEWLYAELATAIEDAIGE